MVDGRLEASVSDNGPGIPPDQLDQLFNPFFTTKAVGEGTGLGLSISDGIARQHGGEIRVESRAGAGATFTLVLPRVEAPAVAAVASTEEPAASRPARAHLSARGR